MSSAITSAVATAKTEILGNPLLKGTGIRDMSEYLTNGWTGSIHMVRIGPVVTIRLKLNGANKTSITVTKPLPIMWRPADANNAYFSYPTGLVVDGGVGVIHYTGTTAGTEWNAAYMTYLTTRPFNSNEGAWGGVASG